MQKIKTSLSVLLILLLIGSSAEAQHLRRKGTVGVAPGLVTDSLAKALGLDKPQGLLIRQVVPGSTAEDLGIEEQDVLLKINGANIDSWQELVAAANTLRANQDISVSVRRGKKTKSLKGKVVARPFESSPHAEVIYKSVPFEGGYLRSIVTKPQTSGKHPAVFFIPGYVCASYDNVSEHHPYRKMLEALQEKGFVTYRIEKTGMGDSEGTPPCSEVDLITENEGWLAGYQQLLEQDYVDKDNIFILGHSMGGVSAPMLAEKVKPKGVIVYGTSHEPWMEYLFKMLRFQNQHLGIEPMQHEKDMRLYYTLLHELFIKKSNFEKLVQNPEYARLLKRDFQWDGGHLLFGRHYKYQQTIHDADLATAWKNTEAHVLSIFGEADFEAVESGSHKAIVNLVNHFHPGHGTYVELEGTNHSLIKVGTMEEGIKARNSGNMRELFMTSFNYKLIDIMNDWMQGVMSKTQ